ncbi:unnamed protein product [Taenia asiatica]|uniref:Reverse transcriptase n=1 Tax=Taenia asiatica TaxID=60517 RepID=A0A0R3WG33_TAEAS|nr:unnamed protein product [Taenia asiatica]
MPIGLPEKRNAEEEVMYQDVIKMFDIFAADIDVTPKLPAVTEKRKGKGEFATNQINQSGPNMIHFTRLGVEAKTNPVLEEVGHESILDPVELEGVSSSHETSIAGDRVVDALAMGETRMQTLLSRVSFMDFLDNHHGLRPRCSSFEDVRWSFNCNFPVQMMDRLFAEEELHFRCDVEIIPVINGPSYSVVTFLDKEFVRPLADRFFKSIALPSDIFIIVLEGSLEIDVYLPKSEESQSEMRTVLRLVMWSISLINSNTAQSSSNSRPPMPLF